MPTKRVLTGMRTTGSLHLGHYVGALEMWRKIQDDGQYECYFLLANVQALTTHSEHPEILVTSVQEVVLDWLSVGLNPALPNIHFVLQSQVPERYELSGLLLMIGKYSELLRNPTLKSELTKQINATAGFMVYPLDQVADICMVSPTPPMPGDELLVPVGEDQKAHLEYARNIAERFNNKYGQVFVPCSTLVGKVGRLVGTDGKEKMGKSANNAIFLNDPSDIVARKVKRMYVDAHRQETVAIHYLRAFHPGAQTEQLIAAYQNGVIGDKQLKEALIDVLERFLYPIRQRRAQYEQMPIRDLLIDGTEHARAACQKVVKAVRDSMYLTYPVR